MMAKGKSFKGDGSVRLGENFSLSEKRVSGLQLMGAWPVLASLKLLTLFWKVVLLDTQQTSLIWQAQIPESWAWPPNFLF